MSETMERKTYLSIAFAAFILGGCSHHHSCQVDGTKYYEGRSCAQHFQDDLSNNQLPSTAEPGLIIKPFQFTGRAWFDTDKSVLRPAGKKELDNLVTQLNQAKTRGLVTEQNKVVIIGHTDWRASHRYNQALSERRAKSVASYLKSKGIPTTSMLAIGKGETQPVATNRTRAGMQQNRRVEIHIEGDSIRVVSH